MADEEPPSDIALQMQESRQRHERLMLIWNFLGVSVFTAVFFLCGKPIVELVAGKKTEVDIKWYVTVGSPMLAGASMLLNRGKQKKLASTVEKKGNELETWKVRAFEARAEAHKLQALLEAEKKNTRSGRRRQ